MMKLTETADHETPVNSKCTQYITSALPAPRRHCSYV